MVLFFTFRRMSDMLPRTLVVALAAVVYIVFLAEITKAQVSPVTGCVVDLAFVVDNSGTIRDSSPPGRDNWIVVINFLKTLVNLIKVGPNGNHIGLVEFGNQGYLAFDFTAYTTAKGVIDALGRVKYRGENSNMTGGMRLARERLFDTKYGMRSDASHVMILVTGGKPTYDVDKLPEEIERIKSMGIRIMVVGVTNQVDKTLLQSIVTQPYEQNYAVVENFESIDFIRSQLSSGGQMCRNVAANAATTPLSITATADITSSATPTSKSTVSTKAVPASYEGCMVDVALVLDNSLSMESNWVMLVKFVKTLVTMLNIGPKGTRVGLVEFGNQGYLGFDFTTYTTKKEVIDALSRLRFRGEYSNMTGGMRLARERLFDTKYGMRPDASHVIILVTDGGSTFDADKLPEEVQRIKSMGIRIMAVGVDNRLGDRLLQWIVTPPCQTNYMLAENFETLHKIRDQLISGTCSNVDPNTVNTLPSIATTTPSTTTTHRRKVPRLIDHIDYVEVSYED